MVNCPLFSVKVPVAMTKVDCLSAKFRFLFILKPSALTFPLYLLSVVIKSANGLDMKLISASSMTYERRLINSFLLIGKVIVRLSIKPIFLKKCFHCEVRVIIYFFIFNIPYKYIFFLCSTDFMVYFPQIG